MDWCQNHVSVAGNLHSNCPKLEELPELGSKHASLDDLFASCSLEGDMALEWLSTFVEDCLTSTGNSLPPPQVHPKSVQTTFSDKAADKDSEESLHSEEVKKTKSFLHRIVIPGKARSKRKRASVLKPRTPFSCWSNRDQSFQLISSDPPLLQQAYWLADSELINPGKDENATTAKKQEQMVEEEAPRALKEVEDGRERLGSLEASSNGQQQQLPRRCSHCLAQKTPQWRAGPLGPKTLCNACGVRYKSGRLLPEYRPAKSPTFVSYKHSNSHKKIMEMRMALLPPNS